MKKLLLVFMSMFFVLGTSMAQKDENTDGSVEFGIQFMTPEDGAAITSVGAIYFTFTKNVTAVLPEGGIDIINNDTKEVAVKIVSIYEGDEYYPKNQVNFQFEQKMMPGKDGKDELQSVILETPGTYSYTIPAGCIKSADNEAFPETTFTFSIVGTFPITNYSPIETAENINEIVLTFEKEITAVNLPQDYPLTVYSSSWESAATINEATISEDKKNVTLVLSEPLTAGQYMLSINEGVLTSADGINAYSTLYFRVIDLTPRFITNYQDGDKVEALGDLEITFENVKEVKLVEGADKVYVFPTTGSEIEGTATFADNKNKITVTFGELTEEGEYVFAIPAGMFTMDGVANEAREFTVTLSIAKITPLAIDSVTSVLNEEGAVVAIRVAFNQQVGLAWDPETYQTISTNINLMDDKGNAINLLEYYNPSLPNTTFEYVLGAYDDEYNVVTTPITEAGTYTLDLSQIVVQYSYDPETWMYKASGFCEGTYTLNHGTTAIENIKAEGEQAIYDLLGRRIEKISGAGIYIVNGKKVVIK
ncbi:MAG: hypothetical protein IJC77_00630 [Bacteroidaceae bacterium]|nr:hypothetical protein [Bacteroidaceae bacterium]